MPTFLDRCCNPMNLEKHTHKHKVSLKKLPKHLQIKNNLSSYHRVCITCYKKLLKMYGDDNANKNTPNANNEPMVDDEFQNNNLTEPSSRGSSPLSETNLDITLPTINEALKLLNQSPISVKRRTSDTYLSNKVSRVGFNLKKALGVENTEFSDVDAAEIIHSLKDEFNKVDTSRSSRVQILTLLLSSWSINKVVEVMGATNHMVRIAKNLVTKKGVLSMPPNKIGRPLSDEVVSTVVNFYNDDEMSSPMPGINDCISLRNDDSIKVLTQKRLVLCNLKELYKTFKSRYPEINIGFSSFAFLRPKHCILAGGCGTHTVCVCFIHQNMKLMILGSKLPQITEDSDLSLKTYNDCLSVLVCEEPSAECYFSSCSHCPGVENIKNHLLAEMEKRGIEEITYKQWVSTPRVTLETTIKNTIDFVDNFVEKLQVLLTHNFIAKEQAAYLRAIKGSLKENEYIVIVDFAENYAFVVQDAAPGFHWNNNQATLYTVII